MDEITKDRVQKQLIQNGIPLDFWFAIGKYSKSKKKLFLEIALSRKPCAATPWAVKLSAEDEQQVRTEWMT